MGRLVKHDRCYDELAYDELAYFICRPVLKHYLSALPLNVFVW